MEPLSGNFGDFNTLLVEDNEAFRGLMKDLLKNRFPFMTVDEAGNGREAREKMGFCASELVFMDIKLPDANGLDLAAEFKRRCPHLAVIILTSYDLPEYRKAAESCGADRFVSKETVGDEGFADLIRSVVDKIRHLP
ncbi:MAG: response regulator [Desulfobacterales bacterium]|jgi:DNA-binding NarL/FixJ family response regulator